MTAAAFSDPSGRAAAPRVAVSPDAVRRALVPLLVRQRLHGWQTPEGEEVVPIRIELTPEAVHLVSDDRRVRIALAAAPGAAFAPVAYQADAAKLDVLLLRELGVTLNRDGAEGAGDLTFVGEAGDLVLEPSNAGSASTLAPLVTQLARTVGQQALTTPDGSAAEAARALPLPVAWAIRAQDPTSDVHLAPHLTAARDQLTKRHFLLWTQTLPAWVGATAPALAELSAASPDARRRLDAAASARLGQPFQPDDVDLMLATSLAATTLDGRTKRLDILNGRVPVTALHIALRAETRQAMPYGADGVQAYAMAAGLPSLLPSEAARVAALLDQPALLTLSHAMRTAIAARTTAESTTAAETSAGASVGTLGGATFGDVLAADAAPTASTRPSLDEALAATHREFTTLSPTIGAEHAGMLERVARRQVRECEPGTALRLTAVPLDVLRAALLAHQHPRGVAAVTAGGDTAATVQALAASYRARFGDAAAAAQRLAPLDDALLEAIDGVIASREAMERDATYQAAQARRLAASREKREASVARVRELVGQGDRTLRLSLGTGGPQPIRPRVAARADDSEAARLVTLPPADFGIAAAEFGVPILVHGPTGASYVPLPGAALAHGPQDGAHALGLLGTAVREDPASLYLLSGDELVLAHATAQVFTDTSGSHRDAGTPAHAHLASAEAGWSADTDALVVRAVRGPDGVRLDLASVLRGGAGAEATLDVPAARDAALQRLGRAMAPTFATLAADRARAETVALPLPTAAHAALTDAALRIQTARTVRSSDELRFFPTIGGPATSSVSVDPAAGTVAVAGEGGRGRVDTTITTGDQANLFAGAMTGGEGPQTTPVDPATLHDLLTFVAACAPDDPTRIHVPAGGQGLALQRGRVLAVAGGPALPAEARVRAATGTAPAPQPLSLPAKVVLQRVV